MPHKPAVLHFHLGEKKLAGMPKGACRRLLPSVLCVYGKTAGTMEMSDPQQTRRVSCPPLHRGRASDAGTDVHSRRRGKGARGRATAHDAIYT